MAPFFGWSSTSSRLEPLWWGSLLFTTRFPEIPGTHKISKLFNQSMPNIKAETHKHNKNTLEKAQQKSPDTQLCNCTNKKQCPLNKQCLTRVLSNKQILQHSWL